MFDSTTKLLTLLLLTSDQDRISPNTISTISSGQVMRTKKNQFGVIGKSNSKFSKLTLHGLYGRHTVRRITKEILGVKGLTWFK